MASPVVINSSSPNSIRLPTITPPSRRGSSHNASPSSPGLPSPSALVKSKAAALKSGSRAQALPTNVGLGFATAGSLWRESRAQGDGVDGGVQREGAKQTAVASTVKKPRRREDEEGREKTTGKLKKPKTPARDQAEPAAKEASSITLECANFTCRDDAVTSIAPPKKPRSTKPAPLRPPKQAAPNPRPSVDLSECAFGVYDLGMATQAPGAISAAKKPEKKVSAPEEAKPSGEAATKPRKRRPKSEAVILNSDGPVAEGAVSAVRVAKPASKPRAKMSGPKTKKASKTTSTACNAHPDQDEVAPESNRLALLRDTEIAVEKSSYFAGVSTADGTSAKEGLIDLPQPPETVPIAQQVVVDQGPKEIAAPRKMDWTPVKDSNPHGPDFGCQAAGSPSSASSPKVQLADLLGGFGYIDTNVKKPAVARTVSGEAVTKRRRIELADAGAAGSLPRKAAATSETAEPKPTKKSAGRKKLQTITAFATAAYQPDATGSAEQSTVSEFFAPRKEEYVPAKETAPANEKSKKPRKPRKRKSDGVGGEEPAAVQPKKTKKATIRVNATDFRTKLHSPTRATARMKQQGFLFGTSSQLAVEESPAFIRDMQAAVQASEMDAQQSRQEAFGSQVRSSEAMPSQVVTTPRRGKSCAKVPTAPHGTCLSLEQAHRGLWCVSSRDHDGGFLRNLHKDSCFPLAVAQNHEHSAEHIEQPSLPLTTAIELQGPEKRMKDSNSPLYTRTTSKELAGLPPETCRKPQAVIDLSDTSPAPPECNTEDSAVAFDEHCEVAVPCQEGDIAATRDHEQRQDDDTWMLISSDGPEPEAEHALPLMDEVEGSDSHPTPSPAQSNIGSYISPSRKRSVLQPLDGNASMLAVATAKAPLVGRARAASTAAADNNTNSAIRKPRGRPRKDASAPDETTTSPKKRGRPSKRPIIASDPSMEAAKFKKPKATTSAPQPMQSPSGWLDVDEISDSDSPVTPSPPRRRASSSPAAVPALDMAIDGSPLGKLKEKAPSILAASASFKPGEPQWPAIRKQIFPHIASTIKNAPRKTDPAKPSWYQKILMYDPITLEELTAWLNEQGLRIQVQKQKPKIKKRGRKKKEADGKIVEEETAVEWEVLEEQLQPWMVQKWCEEWSICCVWAGGGWSGRARH